MNSHSSIQAATSGAIPIAVNPWLPTNCPRYDETTRNSFLDRASTWWTALVLMLATLIVPVLLTPVPPLTDYPNHLARCYLLAFGDSDPVLHQMFSTHWRIIPNVAIDLILPRLMHVFSPIDAGRIMLAFCLLVPTTGAIALNRAYFKRRSWWQLASGFAAFNVLFLMGFMNFEIGIGAAMWAAALWIRYRETRPWPTVFFAVILSPVIFFFHLFGFCFYALLIGSYEFFTVFARWIQRTDFRFAFDRAAILAVPILIPIFLYAHSPLEKVNLPSTWLSLSRKLYYAFDWILGYSALFDFLVAASLIAFLVFCVLNGRARISKAGLVASTVLFCVYLVAPFSFKGVYFVDVRLPIMLGFMLFAVFMPTRLTSRQRQAALGFFGFLLVARVAFIADVWRSSERDLQNVRDVIQSVPFGSRVLSADVSYSDNPGWFASMPLSRRLPEVAPTYWHLASFLLLDRHAFWPNIFADETQQPVVANQPYRRLEAVRSAPPSYLDLGKQHFSQSLLDHFPFLPKWQEEFDYVLLLNADGVPGLNEFLPDRLQLIDSQGIAALFRVRKR